MNPRSRLLAPLFFLSGAAGVGYQLVWTKMFTAGLGHEMPALVAVVSAFFAGLAIGSWTLDRRVQLAATPRKVFGTVELVIGGWACLSTLIIPLANQLALRVNGVQPSAAGQAVVTFALPFLTLLPATVAMGATLPAMERWLSSITPDGRCLGTVYALNTAGAVAGLLGSAFVLMPTLGLRGSIWALAGVNLLCGALALFNQSEPGRTKAPTSAANPLDRPVLHSSAAESGNTPSPLPSPLLRAGKRVPAGRVRERSKGSTSEAFVTLSQRRIGITLFFTGLFGIGFEIAGIRVLSQVLEGTIYTFAAVLSVFLSGTAMGAAFYQKYGRHRPAMALLKVLLCGLATAGMASTWFLSAAPTLYDWSRARLGDTLLAVAFSEMLVAASVFGLPTLCMGAVFSHLTQAARGKGGGIGHAAALNTLGATLAGALFGTLLLPACGAKWTLILASAGPLLLLPPLRSGAPVDAASHRLKPGLLALLCFVFLSAVALTVALPAPFHFLKMPPGAKLREYREGAMASVAVIETSDGHRALRVNNRFQMGGTAAALAERRQAHLPLLLHPAPKRALFLGPGTGITLGAASLHPGLVADGVELLPEVIAMMRHFEPENEGPLPKPGVNLFAADARRFVRTTDTRYDVIVADLFHPAQDGAGFLYTREHFEAIRQRLRPGGLFCQWLPLHQMDETTLRIVIRTFTAVFSQTRAFLLHFNVDIPALGLVGTLEPLALPADWLERRVNGAELLQHMKSAGLDRTINLFGCLAAGPKALEQFAGNAAVATDNDPRVSFTAPRFVVRRDTNPHELLIHFLTRCRAAPSDLLTDEATGGTRAFAANLADFIRARDIYLKGLVEEGAGNLAGAIDAYLESARRSLYFTPAYARCVGIVQMLATTDKAAARQLFDRLEKAQPAQPLGRKMLGPLLDLQ